MAYGRASSLLYEERLPLAAMKRQACVILLLSRGLHLRPLRLFGRISISGRPE